MFVHMGEHLMGEHHPSFCFTPWFFVWELQDQWAWQSSARLFQQLLHITVDILLLFSKTASFGQCLSQSIYLVSWCSCHELQELQCAVLFVERMLPRLLLSAGSHTTNFWLTQQDHSQCIVVACGCHACGAAHHHHQKIQP